jgi:phospholipid-binding lipoprotein MlaA
MVNLRARLEEGGGDSMLAGAADEYALVRSAYLQNRNNLIWDGNPPYVPEDDGSMDEPPVAPATPPATQPTTPAPATGPQPPK